MTKSQKIIKRIRPFMKANGFSLSGTTFCRIENDMAFCVGFDIPSSVHVIYYILPLFLPTQFRHYTYGNRLDSVQAIRFPLLERDADEETIDAWSQHLCECLDRFVMPLFEEVNSPSKLLDYTYKHPCAVDDLLHIAYVFKWRLRMYTHLYDGDGEKLRTAIAGYRNEILNCAFEIAAFCNEDHHKYINHKWLHEADEVEAIVQQGKEKEYCQETISETKKLFRR